LGAIEKSCGFFDVAYPPYASAPIYAYVCKHPTRKIVADAHGSEQLQVLFRPY